MLLEGSALDCQFTCKYSVTMSICLKIKKFRVNILFYTIFAHHLDLYEYVTWLLEIDFIITVYLLKT